MSKPKLELYNTLSRKKEPFKPLHDNTVGLYTCGPTVYNYAHIGNLRTYIFEDILQRTLEWDGYKVNRVMNITDVGHLTSDADTGEDKMEKEARAEKKTPAQIADFYTKAFLDDLKKLNIKIPPKSNLAPATKYIKEQQEIIKILIRSGYAYETSKAVYFNVEKFKKYGRLSGQSLEEKMVAARKEVVGDPEKKNPADFALWFKLAGRYKNHIQHWPSPWGEGFPGWHIECSAISTKFLGQPFDIHTGGVDLIGTHHENEIAQSEAAYGKPLAKIWMHGEFLTLKDSKMAKSAGGFITLQTLIDKGFDPLAYRYLVLTSHYRSKLNFTWESLKAAQTGLNNLRDKFWAIKIDLKQPLKRKKLPLSAQAQIYEIKFKEALNDDLNTPEALSVLFNVLTDHDFQTEKHYPDFIELLQRMNDVLRIIPPATKSIKVEKIPLNINRLLKEREKARHNKQFMHADRLRKEIEKLGYTIDDTSSGPVVRKKP